MPKRVRPNDIADAIFHPESPKIQGEGVDQAFGEAVERVVVCYTVYGDHDFLDGDGYPVVADSEQYTSEDNPISFAKQVSTNGRNFIYWIKRASNGRLFNPHGMDEGRHNKHLHHTGENEFQYNKVNQRAFFFYLGFLRSKNLAYLRNAERECI